MSSNELFTCAEVENPKDEPFISKLLDVTSQQMVAPIFSSFHTQLIFWPDEIGKPRGERNARPRPRAPIDLARQLRHANRVDPHTERRRRIREGADGAKRRTVGGRFFTSGRIGVLL